MRLSEFEIDSIKTLAEQHFGKDVQVYLFGSRVNNQQRGGDIDLFISTKQVDSLTIRTKIAFVSNLIEQIGEQKIDVVLENQLARNSGFLKTIHQTGIQLC